MLSAQGAGYSRDGRALLFVDGSINLGLEYATGEVMNMLSKYKFWVGGAFCLLVIGLIIGALRPKHVSGAQPGASPVVEVVQVEQKDVPIYREWIGTLDGLVN